MSPPIDADVNGARTILIRSSDQELSNVYLSKSAILDILIRQFLQCYPDIYNYANPLLESNPYFKKRRRQYGTSGTLKYGWQKVLLLTLSEVLIETCTSLLFYPWYVGHAMYRAILCAYSCAIRLLVSLAVKHGGTSGNLKMVDVIFDYILGNYDNAAIRKKGIYGCSGR